MNQLGKISVRPLTELVSDGGSNGQKVEKPEDIEELQETPQKFRKRKKAATTSKKRIHIEEIATPAVTTTAKTEIKKSRSSRKDPLPGQMRIDTFYKSAAKTYTVPKTKDEWSTGKTCKSSKKPKRRRKALFLDDDSTTTSSDDKNIVFQTRKTRVPNVKCVIDLCSESETEEQRLRSDCQNDNKKAQSDRISVTFEASLKTIDEVTAMPETFITTDLCQAMLAIEETKTPVPLTTSRHDISSNVISTPLKSEMRNCDVWLEKGKSPKIESITNTTPKNASVSKVNKNIQTKTRSYSKKSKKSNTTSPDQQKESVQEQVANATSRITRRRALEKSLNPPSSISDREPACSSNYNRKNHVHRDNILSPSDSNTSRHENSSSKDRTDSNKKQENTKPPTPPDSISRSTLADAQMKNERIDVLLECSYSDDILIISDEQENIKIPKSLAKSKAKNRGKQQTTKTTKTETTKATKVRRPCPPYKVVEGTTFAVDGFRYGDIEGVTHYFLTHFHADHYIGLNRKFSHPLYLSSITARLLRIFIPIDEQYINELPLNTPIEIDGVEVTLIDANHCPGAVMFIFKTRQGRCILHTGDFRACAEMESEPIFWNNDIHTIYLDTTYFPKKYAFCSQSDSIDRALHIIEEFHEKNVGTRILYVCGSYLVGKEKFWSAIAHKLSLKVWTEGNRKKALNAVNDKNLIPLLVDDPCDAHMHVIPMVHLNYASLVEYIEKFSKYFDILFALRPSGWEKNSKPQLRGKVNIVGIEYSEHSSHDELKRFVQYLKPQKVISTVPVSHDAMKTPKIPDNWFKYDTLTGLQHQYQPAITSYFKMKSANATSNKTPPADQKFPPKSSDLKNEMLISPLEKCDNTVPAKEHEEKEKKLQIFDVEEDDDWLT